MKNTPFLFHSTQMIIRVTTPETGGQYSVLEMAHAPSVGPAKHVHPRGPETFTVLAGDYTFFVGDTEIHVREGEVVVAPANTPHRYLVGLEGGRLLVICPPDLENYFWEVGALLQAGSVLLDTEKAIAVRYGQDFLEFSAHWGHK